MNLRSEYLEAVGIFLIALGFVSISLSTYYDSQNTSMTQNALLEQQLGNLRCQQYFELTHTPADIFKERARHDFDDNAYEQLQNALNKHNDAEYENPEIPYLVHTGDNPYPNGTYKTQKLSEKLEKECRGYLDNTRDIIYDKTSEQLVNYLFFIGILSQVIGLIAEGAGRFISAKKSVSRSQS